VAPAHGNGDAPPAAAPAVTPARKLTDLTDAELLHRIDRLEHAVERSREVLIGRYIVVEKEIAKLTHKQPPVVPTPTGGGGGTHVKPKPKPGPEPGPKPKPVPGGGGKLPAPKAGVKNVQRLLNAFTAHFLHDVTPLAVDGRKGKQTNRRIRSVRYYLGYGKTGMKTAKVDDKLLQRLQHVGSPRFFNPAMLVRSRKRRRKQHKLMKKMRAPQDGVLMFEDQKPVAAWIHPYLVWARKNGWTGRVISGYRTPEYSEHICITQRCNGAPRCATCAGRASNHCVKIKPGGAVDVSPESTAQFAQLMLRCPFEPKLRNLVPGDTNHFSGSGH
jgi:hypothetical protein